MKLERLFNVVVLGGASLGLGACGQQAGGGSGGDAPGAVSGTGGHGGEDAAGGSGAQGGGGAGATAGSGGGATSGTGGGAGGPQCTALEFPGEPKDPCGCPCCWMDGCNNDEPCCAAFCEAANDGVGCCGG